MIRAARLRLEARKFFPAVVSPFLDVRGRLLALSFNLSTAVLFYNKETFRRAGLDPDQPLHTWPQMMHILSMIAVKGASCAYATASPAWGRWKT